MAFAWTHGGWRRETTDSAKRAELILHIEEIENKIGDYAQQRTLNQEARRDLTALQEMLKRREEDLAALEESMGLDARDDVDDFVQLKPAPDDNMVIDE